MLPKNWQNVDAEALSKSIKEWGEKEVIPNRRCFDEDHEQKIIKSILKKTFRQHWSTEIFSSKECWRRRLRTKRSCANTSQSLRRSRKIRPWNWFSGRLNIISTSASPPITHDMVYDNRAIPKRYSTDNIHSPSTIQRRKFLWKGTYRG